jgi:hypothetical protein
MRMRTLGTFAAAIATLVVATSSGPAVRADHGRGHDDFARRVAGAYLVDFGCEAPGVPPPPEDEVVQILATFGADGTYVSEDTADFGDNPIESRASGLRGAWKQTGRRRLVLTAVDFEFGADGSFVGYLRWDAEVKLSRRFNRLRVAGPAGLYAVGQDPLDPAETPFLVLDCEGRGRRIHPVTP